MQVKTKEAIPKRGVDSCWKNNRVGWKVLQESTDGKHKVDMRKEWSMLG